MSAARRCRRVLLSARSQVQNLDLNECAGRPQAEVEATLKKTFEAAGYYARDAAACDKIAAETAAACAGLASV